MSQRKTAWASLCHGSAPVTDKLCDLLEATLGPWPWDPLVFDTGFFPQVLNKFGSLFQAELRDF